MKPFLRLFAVTTLFTLAAGQPSRAQDDEELETHPTPDPSPVVSPSGFKSHTSSLFSTSSIFEERERLFPKKDEDSSGLDSRPTRKVYGVDNRGDRELYPELIIEPSIYDRYEVYETDRDGLKKWEPKAIIKQGLYDRYEVYKTDRDGLAVDEPHLIIEENVYGDHKVYKTDRYGMPEDIPSRVIKTDRLGRQQVYRTDRYGMPIGDPIDEKIWE